MTDPKISVNAGEKVRMLSAVCANGAALTRFFPKSHSKAAAA
jgi:hypothetical protein